VAEINMTPLVDVMLVLLVVFIVTAPLMAGRLQLELPRAGRSAAPPAAPATLRVALDARGQLYLDDRPVDRAVLEAAARAAASADPATEVLLRADRAVAYGEVAELISLLNEAGLARLGFVTVPAPGAAR
jgi:biopolymer transport protein ExbD